MFNLIKCELIKLKKSVSFRFLLLTAFGMAMILTTIFIYVNKVGTPPEGITVTGDVGMKGIDAFVSAMSDTQLNILLFSIFAGLFICGEFANRTICLTLSSGHSRFQVYMSKLIVYLMGTFLLLLIFPISLTTGVTLVNGFGPALTGEVVRYMLRSLLLYFLLSLANASICALLAFVMKSVGSTIGVSLGFMLVLGLVLQVTNMTNTSLQWLNKYTSLGQVSQSAAPDKTMSEILLAVAVGVATFIITITLSHLHFKKVDLK